MLANNIQTVSSILKTPENERKPRLKVRFESDDIALVVRSYCEGRDRLQYGNILGQLIKGDVQTDLLIKWLKQLRENISVLNHQCEGLVSALLKISWVEKGDEALQEFEIFLQQLLSAHTNHVNLVLKSLVERFMRRSVFNETSERNSTSLGDFSEEETKQFEHVHRVIRSVLKIIPLSTVMLIVLLKDGFPFIKKNVHQQPSYVFNLLCITKYLPAHRRAILEIIFDQMIKLDVSAPRQKILDAEFDMANGEMDVPEGSVFEMEVNDDVANADDDVSSQIPCKPRVIPLFMADELANVLDVLMNMLLTYIHETCYVDGNLEWEATKKLYKELLSIFDKLVLSVHASNHIQFVMFYICSFRSPLCDGFLDYLWKRVSDPSTSPILRKTAISYIGSFLARAAYVSLSTVTACFDLMFGWLHRYIDSQDSGSRSMSDVIYHGPFFSVCQAVFYVFAFRHTELLNMPKGFSYLQNLNFERIVTCCLNPLRFCLPSIVRNFASIARNYQLAYCYTIIEKNNRCRLETVPRNATDAIISATNALESFFPFDPYLLKRSSVYVSPIYRQYEGPLNDEPVEINNESYDVILEDSLISSSPNAMSLATSPVTIPDFLLYGSSPGFKQSTLVS